MYHVVFHVVVGECCTKVLATTCVVPFSWMFCCVLPFVIIWHFFHACVPACVKCFKLFCKLYWGLYASSMYFVCATTSALYRTTCVFFVTPRRSSTGWVMSADATENEHSRSLDVFAVVQSRLLAALDLSNYRWLLKIGGKSPSLHAACCSRTVYVLVESF